MNAGNDKKKKKAQTATSCDDCVYYDYDEYTDDYSCQLYLDEDEAVRFLSSDTSACPYYKFYDEYKFVRKQN